MRIILFNAFIVVITFMIVPLTANARDWNWSVTPYGWAASSTVDLRINEELVLSGSADFADIVDDLDGAIMLHVEGRAEKFGVFGDLVVIDLGDEPRIKNIGDLRIEAKADPELNFMDFGGTYYPAGEEFGLGFHYGIRVIDISSTVDLRSIGPIQTDRRLLDTSATYVDGLLGFRYNSEFAENWTFVTSADASTGDTENTWSAQAIFGYRVGSRKQNQIRFGYRHYEIELENDADRALVNTDLTLSGPIVGFSFVF